MFSFNTDRNSNCYEYFSVSVPVCPHAGGVGLCELVQHYSIFDYIRCAGNLKNRYGCLGLPLTHCSWETSKRVIGKQCRPRSDAAELGI